MKVVQNELTMEHLGIHALSFACKHVSSSRNYMASSHASQRLTIADADEKIIQTGMERILADYTFSVKMPANGRIIKVIERYSPGIAQNSIQYNPETIVIYEDDDTKEIDYFSIPRYASYHQSFGFEYIEKDGINQLCPGAYVAKDTVFADPSSIADNQGYKYGINLNMAFMSIPSVSEDGIMISRDVLDRLKFRIYETRVVDFGSTSFPLNLFGSKDDYKSFKDIGEYLNDDGILMMLRDYDSTLAPTDMSIYDTMEPDFIFDKGIYVRGGHGRIVDIKVLANNNKIKNLPEEMRFQLRKYEIALLKFYENIIETEKQIRYERKRNYGNIGLKLSPRFHRLLVEALAVTDKNDRGAKDNLKLIYRKTPIDEYRVEFVVEYIMTPNIGYKLTDFYGGFTYRISFIN